MAPSGSAYNQILSPTYALASATALVRRSFLMSRAIVCENVKLCGFRKR